MDNKKIKGVVEEVKEIKSGTTNGRKWTIYKVKFQGVQNPFTTFNEEFLKLVGKEWEGEYKEEPRTDIYGNQTISRTLINPRRGLNLQPLIDEQKKTNKLLGEILAALMNVPKKEVAPSLDGHEDFENIEEDSVDLSEIPY